MWKKVHIQIYIQADVYQHSPGPRTSQRRRLFLNVV